VLAETARPVPPNFLDTEIDQGILQSRRRERVDIVVPRSTKKALLFFLFFLAQRLLVNGLHIRQKLFAGDHWPISAKFGQIRGRELFPSLSVDFL
jgi:hypothetical protein